MFINFLIFCLLLTYLSQFANCQLHGPNIFSKNSYNCTIENGHVSVELVNNGTICGSIDESNGVQIDVFSGVPFAEPPVGQYRLKRPNPLTAKSLWPNNTYLVTEKPFHLRQWYQNRFCPLAIWDGFFKGKIGQEDCLYLDIARPHQSQKSNELLPVAIWMPGGAWLVGSASGATLFGKSVYSGKSLAARGEMIVVTLSYRLSFLSTSNYGPNSDITGNLALYDQEMAIKWVYENIANFGGDPEKIAIFGQSAGAASVGIQLQNPRLQHIIKRGILESGVPYSPWAIRSHNDTRSDMIKNLKRLSCDDALLDEDSQSNELSWDPQSVENCLRFENAHDIANINEYFPLKDIFTGKATLYLPTLPTVDNEIIFEQNYTSGTFSKIEKDILIGHNNHDAYFMAGLTMPRLFFNKTERKRPNFIRKYEYTLTADPKDQKKGQHHLIEEFTKTFFGDDEINQSLPIRELLNFLTEAEFDYKFPNNDNEFVEGGRTDRSNTFRAYAREAITNVYTDFSFRHPSMEFAKNAVSKDNSVYYYQFEEPTLFQNAIDLKVGLELTIYNMTSNQTNYLDFTENFLPISDLIHFVAPWLKLVTPWLGANHVNEVRYIFQDIMFSGGIEIGTFLNPILNDLDPIKFNFEDQVITLDKIQLDGTIFPLSETDEKLGEIMQDFWISFLKNGKPETNSKNAQRKIKGANKWPDFRKSEGEFVVLSSKTLVDQTFNDDPTPNNGLRMRQRYFFEEVFNKKFKRRNYEVQTAQKINDRPFSSIKRENIRNKFVKFQRPYQITTTCEAPKIELNNGCFEPKVGNFNNVAVESFLGVRYAFAKRFEQATYVQDLNGVDVKADTLGPACPWRTDGDDSMPMSEDCLFMNIYKQQSVSPSDKLPVYFYIHGGSFNDGSIRYPAADATQFVARHNIIVVTIDYRMNIFGFLSMLDENREIIPELSNFGLNDMIFALNFVKENIAKFGGDPEKITISGESAGSKAVEVLAFSPVLLPDQLDIKIDKVLMSSGSMVNQTFDRGESLNREVFKYFDQYCQEFDYECLKNIDFEVLKEYDNPLGTLFYS